jgi:hypothetical protein
MSFGVWVATTSCSVAGDEISCKEAEEPIARRVVAGPTDCGEDAVTID